MTIGYVYGIEKNDKSMIYIGSSFDAHKRWCQHRSALKMQTHTCRDLQSAYNQHGADAFSFKVLEELPDCSSDDLLLKERAWAKKNQGHLYNAAPVYSRGARAFMHALPENERRGSHCIYCSDDELTRIKAQLAAWRQEAPTAKQTPTAQPGTTDEAGKKE